jgi:hypothetical protein
MDEGDDTQQSSIDNYTGISIKVIVFLPLYWFTYCMIGILQLQGR